MADTQTNAAASAEMMFSPDDAIETLWVKSFDGEVLGEILFARMAEHFDDPGHRHKMQVLSTMERRTKEIMVAPMRRAGLTAEPLLYGIAAFASTLGPDAQLEQINGVLPSDVKVWAVQSSDGWSLALINDTTHRERVRVAMPTTQPMAVRALTAANC